MRRRLLIGFVLLPFLGLLGCGGGSPNNPPEQDTGTITGTLQAADAGSYQILLDGVPLNVAPGPNGSFEIPNVPAGAHTISFVQRNGNGARGAHIAVTVRAGQRVNVGEVEPIFGGQIAGLVSAVNEDGSLTPLAGVEVIADPNVVYVDLDQPTTTQSTEASPRDPDNVVYRAITDERGSYVIPAVPEGAYIVSVNVPGYEPASVFVYVEVGRTATADFQLRKAIEEGIGTVQGHIYGRRSDGSTAPIAGALVTIFLRGEIWTPPMPRPRPIPLPGNPHIVASAPEGADAIVPPIYRWERFTTLTDENGFYTLNVPSGYLTLTVWAEGYEFLIDQFALQPRQTLTKDYTLEPWEGSPPVILRPAARRGKG